MDEYVDHSGGVNGDTIDGTKRDYYKLNRVLRAVWYYGEAAWSRLGKSELNRCGKSAELLWLAQKLAKSGSVEEAVHKWASASNLAWLALSAETPRLQGSLLKIHRQYGIEHQRKTEPEKILEEMIEGLGEEEQEKVLSLWLHHFTHCPSSDWLNLHGCYAQWCTASRRLLLLQ